MKYRKKPVVVEAVQFTGINHDEVSSFLGSLPHAVRPTGIVIPTPEGEHLASPGDFIIRGIKGEFYPCKPDIFQATYDVAE